MDQCSRISQEAVQELAEAGWTQKEMAHAVGVGRSRISQLVNPVALPVERDFLGSGGTVTVALGRNQSTTPPEQHPVYVRLQKLARSLKFKARVEEIPQNGEIRIRNQMIVACGPRRAHSVADMLRWDPRLGFEQNSEGWHLVDRQKRDIYKSPMDSGQPHDFAYIGRLPCQLDGTGQFLALAGLHEPGTLGAVQHVERHLGELHERFGTEHFSILISCEFDPDTHEIVHTEEILPRREESR